MNPRKARIDFWKSLTDDIIAHYVRLDSTCNAAISAGAMDPNGPLFAAIWKAYEGMLKHIDVDHWILWFINDNEFGCKAKKAGVNGKVKPIRTTRQLACLIVESLEAEELAHKHRWKDGCLVTHQGINESWRLQFCRCGNHREKPGSRTKAKP